MSNKVNFNVGKKNGQEGKSSSTNYIEQNRKKFQEFIAKTDPVDGVDSIPDEISPQQIIKYVNMARTNPKGFANLIREKLKQFTDDMTRKTPHMLVSSIEGKKAYFQAINYCQNFKPIHPVQPNQALMLSTLDHCMDLVRNQYLGHQGKDKSQFWDRIARRGKHPGGGAQNCDHVMWYSCVNYAQQTVMRYIIDQGVPSRGHRKNIFNPSYYYIGVCMLKDPKSGYKHAMNFTPTQVQLINTEFSSKNFKYKRGKNWQANKNKDKNNQKEPQQQQINYNYQKQQKFNAQKKKQPQIKKKQPEVVIKKKQPQIILKKKQPQVIIINPQDKNGNVYSFETYQQNPRSINIKFISQTPEFKYTQDNYEDNLSQFIKQKPNNQTFNIPFSYEQMGVPTNSKVQVYTIKNNSVYTQMIDQQDKQFNKLWENINSNGNSKNIKSRINIGQGQDIFNENFSSHFQNAGKEVQQTHTKTKTITVNGIKKTEITKIVKYSDGQEISTTKII